MTWQEELQALHEALWQTNTDRKTHRNWSTEARELTPEEWARVKTILTEHKPVVQLRNACMGVGCAIDILDHPTYPGLPVSGVASITCKHLPAVLIETDTFRAGDERRFDTGWREFSPFSHSEANTALLALHGLGAPRAKVHYDY